MSGGVKYDQGVRQNIFKFLQKVMPIRKLKCSVHIR